MAETQKLLIHPLPQGIRYSHHNNDFAVCVRLPGENWQDLYEYKVMVDMDKPQAASMVQFDFSSTVEVRAKYKYGVIHDAKIKPAAKGIQPVINGNYVSFFLNEPAKLSLEINGNRHNNLHIFANPIETEKYNDGDPGVIFFGEGIHPDPKLEKKDKHYFIPSNTIVYFAPGSVVRGKFVCDNVENVRFLGRGILDNPKNGFEIKYSENIEVDGITVVNPLYNTITIGKCKDIKVRNLKSFSNTPWSDGFDIFCSENVEIEDIFMRNSDDCIAIYGHRWDYYGDVKNITVKKAILWADIAHPVNIGTHGDTSIEGNVLENFHFSDIDILDHDEDDREYQGCIALSIGDHNLARNMIFENFRIENITEGMLFSLRVFYNEKYCTGPGRGIENITIRNIDYNYNGWPENPSIIEGHDAGRLVKNVTFENIIINGKRAETFEEANIRVGKHTEEIVIK